MLGIAFDFGGPAHMAFHQQARGDSRERHGRGVKERLFGGRFFPAPSCQDARDCLRFWWVGPYGFPPAGPRRLPREAWTWRKRAACRRRFLSAPSRTAQFFAWAVWYRRSVRPERRKRRRASARRGDSGPRDLSRGRAETHSPEIRDIPWFQTILPGFARSAYRLAARALRAALPGPSPAELSG